MELNPSDAGFQDRYIVQEIIKEMAKNRPIDTKGKKGYKGNFGKFTFFSFRITIVGLDVFMVGLVTWLYYYFQVFAAGSFFFFLNLMITCCPNGY